MDKRCPRKQKPHIKRAASSCSYARTASRIESAREIDLQSSGSVHMCAVRAVSRISDEVLEVNLLQPIFFNRQPGSVEKSAYRSMDGS